MYSRCESRAFSTKARDPKSSGISAFPTQRKRGHEKLLDPDLFSMMELPEFPEVKIDSFLFRKGSRKGEQSRKTFQIEKHTISL
jgi:hypothetical protein